MRLNLTVNGKPVSEEVLPTMTLADFLRSKLELTGTKVSCGVGECGACTVVLDGVAVKSCTVLAAQCEGKEVLTIEGLENPDGSLHRLQNCFVECFAVQCGFCTPGFIMTAYAFLLKNPQPTREEIRKAISGNLCRCTGYEYIIDAIELYVNGGGAEA